MILLFVAGCGGCGAPPGDDAPDTPKPDDTAPVEPATCDTVTVTVTVTGAVGASENAVAAVLDATTWRMGDAEPLTRVMSREGGTFTLCLGPAGTSIRVWEMGLWAAWVDVDGDGRLDAATEPLCDTTDGSALADPLYFEDDTWRAGISGTPGDTLTVTLDGDHCAL